MEQTIWHTIMNSSFIPAISWTLVHSLWIGAGVSVLTVLGMIATQQSSSVLRYRMLFSFLVLFLVATGLAGFLEFRNILNVPSVRVSEQDMLQSTGLFQDAAAHFKDFSIFRLVDEYAVWIVLLWAILLVFKLFRLFHSFNYVYRLRFTAKPVSDTGWQEKLKNMSHRLGIGGKITLLESLKVGIPVTIGHFRPIIIVPVGFFLQLPCAQVEAILFHELAHIYRKDYLINLFQTIADTLFFFNPALLWLSALIREQREICCDDFVLAHTAQKSDYLKGLLAFEFAESTGTTTPLVLGVKGSPLARRLYRMIENRNQPLGLTPKAIAFLALIALPVLAGLLISAGKDPAPVTSIGMAKPVIYSESVQAGQKPQKRVARKHTQPAVIIKQKPWEKQLPAESVVPKETNPGDTAFYLASIRFERSNEDMANRVMHVRDKEDNIYELTVSKNKLIALSINEIVVPESELPAHLPLLARIDHAWEQARARKQQAFDQLKAVHSASP
ncbi:MAG TPA: M56 family metallopeptidase [Pedobacter sp.]|uniref:M56 family metallopeptidase n=1 Tax=Pedobacter sp. TaxID=1411316 RepID=UPI002C2A846E|nr:M56 family metallopeptidase [Pedobacter sp.]HMI05845.1 M56 family metallopeptidase [Pedobacter sp.]